MKQIIEEYGTAVLAMVATLMLIGIITSLIFGNVSPLGECITNFANNICGGAN